MKKYQPALYLFALAIFIFFVPGATDAFLTLEQALDAKVATSTYNPAVSTINTNLTTINGVMTEISANLYGTSTSMNISSASTTGGLLGKADYLRLSGFSTSTITTAVQTAINAKQNTIATGTASQYFKGDFSLGTTPTLSTVATTGAYSDLTGKPTIPSAQVNSDWNSVSGVSQISNKPSLATVATTGAYSSLTGLPTIPSAQIQGDWNEASTTLLDYVKNKPSIPAAQIQSDWTQSSTGSLDYIKNKPTRSWATTTRSIVTTAAAANGWQLSTTKDAQVEYSVTLVSTATIAGNSSGYVLLEIASTNSTNANEWGEIGRISNGQAVSLAITLQSVSTGGGQITGYIPAGYYVRLRSVNTAGTPTYTYNSGQEVLLN